MDGTMTLPRLIALYSPAPGCGKSTVADILEVYFGYQRISLADPMRMMVNALLETVGVEPPDPSDTMAKSEMIAELPYVPTYRHLMQTLGTEWGRNNIGEHFWLKLWKFRVEAAMDLGHCVVCDDIRFPNELGAALSMGQAWLITRPGCIASDHASDGGLANLIVSWGATISNDSSIPALRDRVLDLLEPAVSD
jgi:hypothetical protein